LVKECVLTAVTDACKAHYTVPYRTAPVRVDTAVFLKKNPRFRNMRKTSKA